METHTHTRYEEVQWMFLSLFQLIQMNLFCIKHSYVYLKL